MKRKIAALLCVLGLLTGSVLAAGIPEADVPEEQADALIDAQVDGQTGTEAEAQVDAEAETGPDGQTEAGADAEEGPEAETGKAAPTTYVDVPDWEWYAQVVHEVTEKGLMSGIGGGYFGPNAGVNRAMVVTVLWRMEGCPQPESPESFADIDPEDLEFFWYAPQAAWAKEVGIANGYEDGTFHGLDLVTREQMASFLYQYAKYKGQPLAQGSLGLFDDAYQVSEWAVDAVKHVVGMGIVQGDAYGNLDPQGPTTRAALATMLCRMMVEAAG